nr:helix-turn-helix transcriptional regulator [uncultured Butyrivibrio sp.]
MNIKNAASAVHIAKLRRSMNITQPEFGEKIAKMINREKPFTTAIVSAWEMGRRQPSIEAAEAMAKLFNTSVDYILGNTNVENEELSSQGKDYLDKNPISYDDLQDYHGRPVYLVFPEKNQIDCWGIVDLKDISHIIFHTVYGEVYMNKKDKLEVYPLEADLNNVAFIRNRNRLGISQIIESNKPVYVEMKTYIKEIKASYDGWYKITDDKSFLQNDTGRVLPLSGMHISYEVYSDNC